MYARCIKQIIIYSFDSWEHSIFTLRQMVISLKPCLFLSCNHCLYIWDFWSVMITNEYLICKHRSMCTYWNWKLKLGANKSNKRQKGTGQNIKCAKKTVQIKREYQGVSNKYFSTNCIFSLSTGTDTWTVSVSCCSQGLCIDTTEKENAKQWTQKQKEKHLSLLLYGEMPTYTVYGTVSC